jgi:2-keto-4-pentenoate hydratase/2-oxohepta-3-ene-1,7-dioic acid hydratase in catechol pathway
MGSPVPLVAITALPPCRPGKIIGLWNNFRAAADKNGWAVPAEPLYFLKSPGAAAAHGQAIPVPGSYDGRVAYEGELVIVIGRRARAVPVEQAGEHIFGYTCGNDVTAMELLNRDPAFAAMDTGQELRRLCRLRPRDRNRLRARRRHAAHPGGRP